MSPPIADALASVGITEAFPIQEMTLPVALAGADIIGQAKTGTGKTLAFGVPVLERALAASDRGRGRAPDALVVVPTRELAVQVATDLETAGPGARVLQVYGGRAYEPQVDALKAGVDVVVGTPGRLIDLLNQGVLDLGSVRTLVLDEADEMLDLGFLPDVERLLSRTPDTRQTLLFSATMPSAVVALARQYMDQPVRVSAVDPNDADATVATVEQHVLQAHDLDKPELLARVLQARGRGLTMVFCRTKRAAQRVVDDLAARGFAAAAVHGDLGQGQREQALRAFRNGKVDVLVATDVAARGIDVEAVTHVVNYECPDDEKTYLHRIGRTGRAGASGVAVTLVDWADVTRWQVINKALGLSFYTPVETYSTSPHLLEILDIPAEAASVLPRAERTRAGLDAEAVEDLGETGRRPTRDRGRDGTRTRTRRRSDAPLQGGGREEPTEDRATRATRGRQRRRTRAGVPVETSAATPAGPANDPRAGAVDPADSVTGAAS